MAAPMPTNGAVKRSRPESVSAPPQVIEISDYSDEDLPPPKRHKSTTPVINDINAHNHQSAKPNSVENRSDTESHQRAASSSRSTDIKKPLANSDILFRPTQNKSLFKNVPPWAAKNHTTPGRISTSKEGASATKEQSNEPLKDTLKQSSSTPKSSPAPTPKLTPSKPRVSPNGPPRRSPRQSASPAVDRYNLDSTDDDLKILENFKVTDDSAKQDRLRQAESLVVAAPESQPVAPKRESLPRRSSFQVKVPHRPNPSAPSPARKPALKPVPKPVVKHPSTPGPKPTQKPAPGPSYQFVSSPSTQFQLVVPLSQDGLGGSQPKYRIDHAKERNLLYEQLKQSIEPIKTRFADVERYFGQTGFSEAFNTDEDQERLRKAASKKKRKVKRRSIKLDWGDPPPPPPPRQNDSDSDDTSTTLVHPTQQVKQLLTARFQETHSPPLTFANDINDRRLNGKFQFVDRYIFRSGVRTANSSMNYGCNCPNGTCNPTTCSCSSHNIDDKQIVTYTRRDGDDDDRLVVLSDEYMQNELTPSVPHFEISECNEACPCPSDCFNRVVAHGRTIPLEIFETSRCGFGVRSSVNVSKGQFIDLYLGEVITQQELERRENAKEENASSYIYSLDWFAQQNCYHVDGENFGTAMRFVNHCCSPNARNFTVQMHKGDKHVYYLAFFAIKDIPAGTEICIDYSPQEEGKYVESEEAGSESAEVQGEGDGDPNEEDEDEEGGRARCYCGAPNCRKFLWRSAGRKRKVKTTKHD